MKLRTLIADDEPLALNRLKRLLADMPLIELIGEANNGSQLTIMAESLKPDLVITDVRMPGMSGLEAAQSLNDDDHPPAIIFCTAYDQYAIQAFDAAAVGYVVKPVDAEKLTLAIERAANVNQVQLASLAAENEQTARLMIDGVGSLESLDLAEIDFFKAEDKTVLANLGEREVVVDYSLRELENMLDEHVVRVHRSSVVNVRNIKRLFRQDNGQTVVEFASGQQVPVSRRLVAAVKRAFKSVVK